MKAVTSQSVLADQKIRQWLPWMIVGLGGLIRLMLLRFPGYAGDVDSYVLWSRQMVIGGFSTAYTLKEPIVNYPPVVLGVLALIGQWYRAFISPAFSLAQLTYFTLAVKIVFDLRRKPEPATLWSAAAFVALGSFLTLTGLHENHTYMLVALLSIATGLNVRLLPLLVVYSLTAILNMLAHDPLLLFNLKPLADVTGYGLYAAIRLLTWLNALVNVLGMMWWSLRLGPLGLQSPQAPRLQKG